MDFRMNAKGELTASSLHKLHWDQNLSLHQMASILGISRRSLVRTMKGLGVRRRSYTDAMKLRRKPPILTKEELSEKYLGKQMSCTEISFEVGVSATTVSNLIRTYNIPRRPVSEANRRYSYQSFGGNRKEAAYLLGFRTGDLHMTKVGTLVRASTTSTHPAMGRLFDTIFSRYAHVGRTPSHGDRGYQWAHYSYLDSSFDFLLNKPKTIPQEIMEDMELFLAFLAGYLDAEGSYRVYRQDETTAFSLRINSEDERILRGLAMGLRRMGYHVSFKLAAKHSDFPRYTKNLWTLGMFRNAEILDLTKSLEHLHDEKVRWQSLIENSHGLPWNDVCSDVNSLRADILRETREYIAFAQMAYEYRHPEQPFFANSLINSTALS